MRNQMLSVQLDIKEVQVQLATTVPSLNAQVLSLKTMLSSVNKTISTLNLQRFTAEVDALTTTISGLQGNVNDAQTQLSLVQGSIRDTQNQVASLMQRTQTIDAAYHRLQAYNATVWSSLQNWTAGFQASSTSTFSMFCDCDGLCAELITDIVVQASMIVAPMTVYVGAGQRFTSLLAAWNWATKQALLAPLTIQILDGVYNEAFPDRFPAMSMPQRVTIIGNRVYPDRVQFVCTCGSGKQFWRFAGGASGISLFGFTLVSSPSLQDNYGITASAQSYLYIEDVVITGFGYGLYADYQSLVDANQVTISQCFACVSASAGASVVFAGSITGSGAAGSVALHSFVNGLILGTGSVANVDTGVRCDAFLSLMYNFAITFSQVNKQFDCPNQTNSLIVPITADNSAFKAAAF